MATQATVTLKTGRKVEMGNDIATIGDISEKIRERIQAEFVTLVPKEMWDSLVKKEVAWFLSDTGYRKDEPSPLKTMVRRELEKMFIEQVRTQLNEMQGSWGGDGNMQAGAAVRKMVEEIAPHLWELAVSGVVQRAIDQFRSNLSSQY